MTKINWTYFQLLRDLLDCEPTSSPRGMLTRERLGITSKVAMQYPIVTHPDRKMGYQFMFAEAWWILSGRRDFSSIVPYAKNIKKFSNDYFQFDGAYGPMVMEQMRYVVDTLVDDEDSRQAVITIWRPNPRPSKDIPCTISLQFLIREKYLHCIATMRSSDAWLGWVYDVFNFSMISLYVALRVNQELVSEEERVELGALHLTAGSQHLYEQDFEKALNMGMPFEQNIHSPCFSTSQFPDPNSLIEFLNFAKDNVITGKEHKLWTGLALLNGLYESRK